MVCHRRKNGEVLDAQEEILDTREYIQIDVMVGENQYSTVAYCVSLCARIQDCYGRLIIMTRTYAYT